MSQTGLIWCGTCYVMWCYAMLLLLHYNHFIVVVVLITFLQMKISSADSLNYMNRIWKYNTGAFVWCADRQFSPVAFVLHPPLGNWSWRGQSTSRQLLMATSGDQSFLGRCPKSLSSKYSTCFSWSWRLNKTPVYEPRLPAPSRDRTFSNRKNSSQS